MKKGIFCVLVCLIMVLTAVVPVSATISWKQTSQLQVNTDVQYGDVENIFNELLFKLDKVTTKQDALVLFKETIVELHNHGLLPNELSVRQAQLLMTMWFLKNALVQPSYKSIGNNTGNTNCLVVGVATETWFRPYPSILLDIPIVRYLVFNGSLSPYLEWVYFFWISRFLSPVKFGPYAYVGERYKTVIAGNVTEEISPAKGLVWTIGVNGIQKWNGSFYGSLSTKYEKSTYGNDSYESWESVGIHGFVGISLFNFISFAAHDTLPRFYIGYAREINFTYSPPWT